MQRKTKIIIRQKRYDIQQGGVETGGAILMLLIAPRVYMLYNVYTSTETCEGLFSLFFRSDVTGMMLQK